MKKLLFIILFISLCSCTQMDAGYVQADRATYEALAPEYLDFVNDSTLDDDEKDRRRRLVESWNIRIKAAEEGEE